MIGRLKPNLKKSQLSKFHDNGNFDTSLTNTDIINLM